LRTLNDRRAVSTLVLVLLLLCSMVIGALISYIWTMGSFYLEPENTVTLTITDVNFPVEHADYFNFTVMNPAHSVSSTNITTIYFGQTENTTLQKVLTTYPDPLPITIERGTSKTIKCSADWSLLAGKNVTVHVAALQGSGATKTLKTKYVGIGLDVSFNPLASSKYFNVTLKSSPSSAINLTISKVKVNAQSIPNADMTPLPSNLTIGGSESFTCKYNWENLVSIIVSIETEEGYHVEKTINASASVLLVINDVRFNETDAGKVDIAVENSQVSKTAVDIDDITLTYANGTKLHLNGSLSTPQFSPLYRLGTNQTVTFKNCPWDWRNFRNQNITVTVHTKQNFTDVTKTVKTPQPLIFKTSSSFSLNATGYFLVNATNSPTSTQDITVTQIRFNTTQANFTTQVVPIGETRQFNCSFDWMNYRGKTVPVSVNASGVVVSQLVTLPSVVWSVAGHANATEKRLFNVTIMSSGTSLNATLARIVVTFGNTTIFQAQGVGILVQGGGNVTLMFTWDWSAYATKTVKIAVYTTQDKTFEATYTFP